MKYWHIYTAIINRNCSGAGINDKDLAYWRNDLFARTIIYLLPFSIIALVPGIYLSFISGLYLLAATDMVIAVSILLIGFLPGISLLLRKIIFIACIYILSIALLYYLGLPGPGLVYLLNACIFSILIFTTGHTFWSAWLNTAICVLFAVNTCLGNVPLWLIHSSVSEWVGVSSNLIFLSFLSAALIPRLFNGLQQTIQNEKQLKETLDKQQQHLQQALAMLEQKNKELEQFAYVASHDLKEPLRMVTSFMGLLQSKYGSKLDQKAHIYITFALDGGRRMQKMIDDLLDLSRTNRYDLAKEAVNLADTLEEVKHNILKLIEDNDAEIIVKTKLPVAVVYKAGISRLLQNLLINAIKFRKKTVRPLILVSAAETAEEWLFSIEDNGIGIEHKKFEKIFDIFTRLHAQQDYEGTGIGLAVCKKVAEHHGGRIWVTSEEGKGSTFYFTIKKQNL